MMRSTCLFAAILAALLYSVAVDISHAKSRLAFFFSQAGLVRHTVTRIYLTELFSVSTDTFNWIIPRDRDPLRRTDYCADRADIGQYLDRSGSLYALKRDLFQDGDLSVWPLKCIPTKIVSTPEETKSGTLRIAALHLIDPQKLVDRLMLILDGKQSMAEYVMDRERYLQIYSHAAKSELDSVKSALSKNIALPIGLGLEHSAWFRSEPEPILKYLPRVHHRRPAVIVDDHVFTLVFEIDPFVPVR